MKSLRPTLILVCATCALATTSVIYAVTLSYTQRVAYYTTWASGGGTFDQDTTEIGQWANTTNTNPKQTVAWRVFKTAADNTGSARHLVVGDEFTIQLYASSAYGGFGVSLNSAGWSTGSWANRYSNSRVYLEADSNSGQWYVNSAAGNEGFGANVAGSTYKDYVLKVKITSENTVTVREISDSTTYTKYDRTLNGTVGTNISGYAVFLNDDFNGSGNANIYWKPTTQVENTGAVEFGGDNASRTIAGRVSDGLAANSTSTVSANKLYKIGSGTVVLSANNTYSGGTQVESGTLSVSNDTNLGTAPGTVSPSHIVMYNLAALMALDSFSLNSNRGISNALNALCWIGVASGKTLTYDGVIAGANTGFIKNESGTFKLGGESTFTGNIYVDNGIIEISLSSGDPLDASTIYLGKETTSDGDTTLKLSGSGVSLDNAIAVRTAGHARKIESSNTSNTNTLLGNVSLDTDATTTVSTGGALAFSGATIDLKNRTLTVDGAGNTILSAKLTNSTGSGKLTKNGTGTLTIGNRNNDYSGATTVNAGTLNGSGKVSGAMTLNSGASVAPGSSIGNLLTGDLTMNAGSSYAWEFNATTSDWIGASVLALAGGATHSVTVNVSRTEFVTYPVTRTLFTYSSFTTTQTNALWLDLSDVAGDNLQPPTITVANNTIMVTLVPEPACLLALAGVLLALRRAAQ
jgi:autotransporter-associated beta strand protein